MPGFFAVVVMRSTISSVNSTPILTVVQSLFLELADLGLEVFDLVVDHCECSWCAVHDVYITIRLLGSEDLDGDQDRTHRRDDVCNCVEGGVVHVILLSLLTASRA